MNKKIFGLRLGTIISFVVCIIVAILIWLYAKYMVAGGEGFANALLAAQFRG